ncbi:GGDEF domain-containing protein [Deinococcus sp. QL22]|uniref:GGDEF domain-containing protein n=1 Tax=Deinococcus sp. QL22 TaxID=2939437 RepID=UPI0020182ADC|nr:GGDEF domain-containing protein [Deinococcus sp. QL22]UQN07067.1 GGDEF domain-containing protein [Deinococcus sp. QL22]
MSGRLDRAVLGPDAVTAAKGSSVFRLGHDRRATYCLTLPLAAVAALASLVLRLGNSNAFDQVGLPALVVLILGLWVLACTRRASVDFIDGVLLVGAWVFLLGRIGFTLFAPALADRAELIAATAPWLPILLMAHSWGLGERRALGLSLMALAATGLLVLLYALTGSALNQSALTGQTLDAQGSANNGMLNTLVQMLLAGGVTVLGQRAVLRHMRDQASGSRTWLATRGADQDPLTGLPNRVALEKLLTGLTARRPSGLAVAVLGLDHLGRLQEERGEAFTERLTAHVARTLSATVRDQDVVGRLSQTEFALLLRVPDDRAARAACERLRVRVASLPLDGVMPTITVGVTVWAQHVGSQDMLEDASRALRQAQDDGRNRVQLAGKLRTLPTDLEDVEEAAAV